MIRILDCKNPNYLSRLKLILNKRRFKSKINTDIVIKIVKDITSKGFVRSDYKRKLVDLSDIRIDLKGKK